MDRIAIVGFNDYKVLSDTMEKLITDSKCYLFTVVCGSTVNKYPIGSIGEKWAIDNGVPIEYIYEENEYKLLDKVAAAIDFLVASRDSQTGARNLIMKVKQMGKHGIVV